MLSNHLILCLPLLLLPSIFPNIRVFSKESTLCIKWPKNWNFHFSNSPSNEYCPTPNPVNYNLGERGLTAFFFFFELCISIVTGGFWSSLMLRVLVYPRSHEMGILMTGWSRDTWSLARIAPTPSKFDHKDNTLAFLINVSWALRSASQSRVIHHAA